MSVESISDRIVRHRKRVDDFRQRAQSLFLTESTAVEVARNLGEDVIAFLIQLANEACVRLAPERRRDLKKNCAIAAVGGTGRGDLAPFSDADLVFLHQGTLNDDFKQFSGQMVRDCWDCGLKLGHSVHTVASAVTMARNEPEFATSLIEMKHLWGDESLVRQTQKKFYRRIVRARRAAFVAECIANRENERFEHGGAAQQLEPDVKRSVGGLRDLHLIRWVAFANFGTPEIAPLRERGILGSRDADSLTAAHEYLTRIRFELHFAAGKTEDVLSRDAQLALSERWGFEAIAGQRPVERFMREYFQHSMAVADVTRRFISLNQPRPVPARVRQYVMTHRVGKALRVGAHEIDITSRHREEYCGTLEKILDLYRTAALYRVDLAPILIERIKRTASRLNGPPSVKAAELFLETLNADGNLGSLCRSMYDTGVLDLAVDAVTHARCLLQFNQYHSYTVDEHTLRAIEAAEQFTHDSGPVGSAYRAIHRKDLLHLALLLHDLGKGFPEDHCVVGRRIAEETSRRLHLSEHETSVVVFLVEQHLMMSHLAFRRNFSAPEVLLDFTHTVGSPEVLRMLYVLTAADMTAVGPGVWTEWKAELLSELYSQAMLILGGKHPRYLEEMWVHEAKAAVSQLMLPDDQPDDTETATWLVRQLDAFSPNYLTTTPAERIAADLKTIRDLREGDVHIEGANDSETGTVDYRILMGQEYADGCFHRIVGVLAAKHMDVLSAQIATNHDGMIVDVLRVIDNDFEGDVPPNRVVEVADALKAALKKETTVPELFQRHTRFDADRNSQPIAYTPPRVVIDNNSSDSCTIIDVFAHDQPGLLYTIARQLFQLDLSVDLAKIGTQLDQIVDVFYVTESDGKKPTSGTRLREIQQTLEHRLHDFESSGHEKFVG